MQGPETKGTELLCLNSSKGLSAQKHRKRTSFLKGKQTGNWRKRLTGGQHFLFHKVGRCVVLLIKTSISTGNIHRSSGTKQRHVLQTFNFGWKVPFPLIPSLCFMVTGKFTTHHQAEKLIPPRCTELPKVTCEIVLASFLYQSVHIYVDL